MHENLCRKLIVELDYSEHAAAQTATDLLRIDHLDIKHAVKYSLQGTTQGRYLTGGVPPVRFSM